MNGSNWMLISAALIALLLALAIGAVIYGSRRWEQGTREILAQLEAARISPSPAGYDARELEGLPAPVQRYFRVALKDGQPIVTAAFVKHAGTFNMGATAEQWKPFTSAQRVITRRPGFDWDARIMMLPGVPAHVHDAYVAGEGLLHGALFGLVPVVHIAGTPEIARGELLRFFAEAAWYPTALLPSQGVRWEAVDDTSARATLTDGSLAVTMLFRFNAAGLIDTVRAESRARVVDGKTESAPWQGRFWNYAERGGMQLPLDGEVAWVLLLGGPLGEEFGWRGLCIARDDRPLRLARGQPEIGFGLGDPAPATFLYARHITALAGNCRSAMTDRRKLLPALIWKKDANSNHTHPLWLTFNRSSLADATSVGCGLRVHGA